MQQILGGQKAFTFSVRRRLRTLYVNKNYSFLVVTGVPGPRTVSTKSPVAGDNVVAMIRYSPSALGVKTMRALRFPPLSSSSVMTSLFLSSRYRYGSTLKSALGRTRSMMWVSPAFILIGYALKYVPLLPYFGSLSVHLSLTVRIGLGAWRTVKVYSSLPTFGSPKKSGSTMISYSLVSFGVNVMRDSPGLKPGGPNGGCTGIGCTGGSGCTGD